ncbi:hypothetical protein [Prosthecochloris sp. HL-130-GSB]|jgi:hypothetical protein|uniref:hypothetical protein n=1 Tax=Prosthecochloris sp. HL-130-GSB TaxID=1974213 RepID=UPI000A1BFF86|nr:hypothetical protein [Prosthecochloris sp. HL-130-GSB]ARM30404.1 hypothetical protein B9H02_02500 [Prosthecochloris sp. HL-130-GSB]
MQSEPKQVPDTTTKAKTGRKKPSLLAITVILGTIGLVTQLLWVNWPKSRTEPEPLSTNIQDVIDRLPGTADALIYAGVKDIRESKFWNEVIPDSVKAANWLQFDTTLTRISRQTGFIPSRDIDTLLVEFQQRNARKQDFLGIVWGNFPEGLDIDALEHQAVQTISVEGRRLAALREDLWICRPSGRMTLIGSSADIIGRYLAPHSSFLERDTTTTALLEKTAHKSHFWFTLSSPYWTIGALQSLTSANKDLQTLGNINRIRHLTLSLKLDENVEGTSEWIYENRRSAYFASTFLWSAIKLSSTPGTRTPQETKDLLNSIHVMQNLESVIVTADIPAELFRKTLPAASTKPEENPPE